MCYCLLTEGGGTTDLQVFFLMPCHSTPFHAHIHSPIHMDFIRCLPPIKYDGCGSTTLPKQNRRRHDLSLMPFPSIYKE
jgi:hypothetical protein